MGKDFQNFFVLFDEKLTFFNLFESDEYKGVSFYYQIFNEKDLGIYYSIAKDYFIFANSKKILEKILEILKLTEREKIKTPLFNIKLPILRYHHVNFLPENPSKALKVLTVSPPMFEKQMKYLFEKGYQPITFKDLINYFKFKEKLPEKPLILTFDDGWENQYQNALPVLKKYNFPATFFVVVNYIGKKNFMDWQQLKEILKLGGEIGSHTLNHPHLLNLSEVQLKKEIQKSKIILEEKLGYPINIFAYPYGEFNSKIIKIVLEAGYFAARSCREGLIQSSKDIFKLKSIRVLEDFEKFKRIFEKE
jgi:peptidoglycan/xylan/chitin deacetylase (PgdA/CDA1 family)